MEDQLISFETAKLAKEKGFDWGCNYHIISNSYESSNYSPYSQFQFAISSEMNHLKPLTNKDLEAFEKLNLGGRSYIWSKAITQPTQSLLQRWLREVHGIHVSVHPTFINKKWYIKAQRVDYPNDDIITGLFSSWSPQNSLLHWDTYEEALEAALQITLRLKVEPISELFIKKLL